MPKEANITFHKIIYRHTDLNSDGYGTVNDEILPSNLVPELFGSVFTDMPELKK